MIQTAVMGFGTIGSGVAEVIDTNREGILKATGQELHVKYILDLRNFPGNKYEDRIIHDFNKIVGDPEIRIVVETMGGVHPAYEFTKACLEAGKHVVTSNKAVVEDCGTELLAVAREHHVNYLFEASVGGGIPLIRPLTQSLKGEKILEIQGILNGTTNFILTKMDREGQTFEEALRTAQELGYAEKNPEADVMGHDTCRKIVILSMLATGKEAKYKDVHCEGITAITPEDFAYAKRLGCAVKLVGTSRMGGSRAGIFVCPMLVPESSPLYAVNDVYNAVMVNGRTLGKVMFYGSGAGKLPTANAVVSDVVEILDHLDENMPFGWTSEPLPLGDFEDQEFQYFVRFRGSFDTMTEELRTTFDPEQVVELPDYPDEFAILTEKMAEESFQRKQKAFEGILQVIRR